MIFTVVYLVVRGLLGCLSATTKLAGHSHIRVFEPHKVTGTLSSPAMLALARGNLNELGIGNVALVEAPLSSRAS